ncbi:hypothetical protein TBLA_0D01320 [Henningerozyma blattae CBS 6284]|uniref:Polynucleotide 5'-hydroxyl-kinase GRC3 n=1 Tax=Henningerozyma blattae (strain ATCC 34711 / CBS 6284 / DSM 70876 / NBRC 10599 / NRRL Y-10934 / UCD 77-7) TaxID=1071380 RepID=I2H2N8_HENB6|nr:hypothetical protein TBLA_0D01320 [Tetrapisispora blattae CBS 6284]CCH60640.1 hypothetical protein TBLA_0D01320 [Tetrapisispora blattae CBS 6284]
MSVLPGLTDNNQLTDSLIDASNEIQQLNIPAGSEWRIELSSETKLDLKIKSGIAEIFGTELANDINYSFKNWKFPIYAVEDVKLEWKCPELASKELNILRNNSQQYIYNLHFAFEKMRGLSFDGFRAMVVGKSSSGKTSLCRTLASYAIKSKPYQPLYVNTNPQDGILSMPGCLTATPISDILDAQSATWGQSMTSGATALHSKQPLVRNFGLENVSENRKLYMNVITQLANDVRNRLEEDSLVCRSGTIIDSPPLSVFDDDFIELKHIVKEFNVNILIVLCEDENDQIWKNMKTHLQPLIGNFVLRAPILDGVVKVDDVFKRSQQRDAIREYFYGTPQIVLSPYAIGVDYEDITMWKPMSNMEQDWQNNDKTSQLTLKAVEITSNNIQHAIVAITYVPKNASGNEVEKANILGFGLVMEVNEKKGKFVFFYQSLVDYLIKR